jgi:hypothetical protein
LENEALTERSASVPFVKKMKSPLTRSIEAAKGTPTLQLPSAYGSYLLGFAS